MDEKLPIEPVPTTPVESTTYVTPSQSNSKYTFIVAILIFSVVAVGGIILFSRQPVAPVTTEEISALPSPNPFFLTIDQPQGTITTINGELLVSGKTLPNTAVVIYSDTDETSVESDGEGKFEETIVVGDNGGLVRVTAYSITGDELSKTFSIGQNQEVSYAGNVYVLGKSITAETKQNEKMDKSNVSKNTTVDIDMKVQNKILSNPNKNQDPNIINTKPDNSGQEKKSVEVTTFLKEKKQTKKVDKIGLSKIKDILVRNSSDSGKLKNPGQLKKMAAAVATNGAELKRHAVMGVITELTDGTITLAHQTQPGRSTIVYYNTNTVIAMKNLESSGAGSLQVGMRIAAVGTPTYGGILAKRIQVIPGKAIGVFNNHPIGSTSGSLSPSPITTTSGTPIITETIEPTAIPSTTPTATLVPSPEP